MHIFVTFGQVHAHSVEGKTLDKDTVAVLEADTHELGRDKAFKLFGDKFFSTYTDPNDVGLQFFPKGFVYLGEAKQTADEMNLYEAVKQRGFE